MREDTVKALEEFKIVTFGSKKNILRTEALIAEEENILCLLPTDITITNLVDRKEEDVSGIIVLTDRRIVIHYQILQNSMTEALSLGEVISVGCNSDLSSGNYVEIVTGNRCYHILVSYKLEKMQKIRQAFEDAKNKFNDVQHVSGSGETILKQIEQLGELWEKGILTEEEFQTKKADLLSRL